MALPKQANHAALRWKESVLARPERRQAKLLHTYLLQIIVKAVYVGKSSNCCLLLAGQKICILTGGGSGISKAV